MAEKAKGERLEIERLKAKGEKNYENSNLAIYKAQVKDISLPFRGRRSAVIVVEAPPVAWQGWSSLAPLLDGRGRGRVIRR